MGVSLLIESTDSVMLSLSLSLSLSHSALTFCSCLTSAANTDGYNPEDPGLSSSSSSHGFIPTPIIAPHPLSLQQSFPPPSIGGRYICACLA